MRRIWWVLAGPLMALDWLLHKWRPKAPFGLPRWYVCRAMEWTWTKATGATDA